MVIEEFKELNTLFSSQIKSSFHVLSEFFEESKIIAQKIDQMLEDKILTGDEIYSLESLLKDCQAQLTSLKHQVLPLISIIKYLIPFPNVLKQMGEKIRFVTDVSTSPLGDRVYGTETQSLYTFHEEEINEFLHLLEGLLTELNSANMMLENKQPKIDEDQIVSTPLEIILLNLFHLAAQIPQQIIADVAYLAIPPLFKHIQQEMKELKKYLIHASFLINHEFFLPAVDKAQMGLTELFQSDDFKSHSPVKLRGFLHKKTGVKELEDFIKLLQFKKPI